VWIGEEEDEKTNARGRSGPPRKRARERASGKEGLIMMVCRRLASEERGRLWIVFRVAGVTRDERANVDIDLEGFQHQDCSVYRNCTQDI